MHYTQLIATALPLGWVGEDAFSWSQAKQENVPFMAFALSELLVCAVEPVQDTHHPVHLVEPVVEAQSSSMHTHTLAGWLYLWWW